MQNPNVAKQRRGPPGMRSANQLGSQANCFRTKSNRRLRTFQHPRFDHESACRVGMRVRSGKGTDHIHGIGKPWQNWSALQDTTQYLIKSKGALSLSALHGKRLAPTESQT